MKGFIFLVVTLAVAAADFFNTTSQKLVVIGEDKDILEANNAHDDILEPPKKQRSAIINDNQLWTSPVPYVLDTSLDMNAKGVVLRAFEQFRLKSCIDFKPRDAEDYYITVTKLNGCFSYIGRVISGGQNISIGQFCDTLAIVEHEFLHALGFFHEQSRRDRDEHVTILFENILAGRENNFAKVNEESTTTNGVPYDYDSVMHYGKNAFSNGKGITIKTKNATLQDKIGQRLEMSPRDVKELNLRYNCNSTIAFQMHCNFSDSNMCQMRSCSQRGSGWEMKTSVQGGPSSDHTNLLDGSGFSHGSGAGYFMHASTASGQEGDSAYLETHKMNISRDCHVQCLQFYYYNSGSESDQLNIWIREFQDESNFTLRLMDQITGKNTSHWQLKHVSLNATKHFQVVFETHKGAGNSSGGFSIDDINLSEIECPHVTIQIDDFEKLLNTSPSGTTIRSPRQYSRAGYAFLFGIYLSKPYVAAIVQLLSGDNDDQLTWPIPQRQVSFQMVDQKPNIQLQMSKEFSITSDLSKSSSGIFNWDNPRKNGTPYAVENNETIYAGPLLGRFFTSQDEIKNRSFLMGGSAVFVFSFQDLTPLLNGSALPCSLNMSQGSSSSSRNITITPCTTTTKTTTPPPTTTTDGNSVFGLSPVLVCFPVLILLLVAK